MHNAGFFPDCHLLSLINGSIWIPYLARYSEVIKKPNFQLKNDFQAEFETEGSRFATIFGLPPTHLRVPDLVKFQSILLNFPVPETYAYLSGSWKMKMAKLKVAAMGFSVRITETETGNNLFPQWCPWRNREQKQKHLMGLVAPRGCRRPKLPQIFLDVVAHRRACLLEFWIKFSRV